LFLAVVAGGLWWWLRQRPAPAQTLAPDWPALVTTIAGDGIPGTRDGSVVGARLVEPFGVALASDGAIWISDGRVHTIRRLAHDAVTTIAGGVRGFQDGPGSSARLDTPSAIAFDSSGTLYIADTGNNVIRRLTSDGQITTIAGDSTAGYVDGPHADARFNGPVGLTVDRGGRIIIADTYNDRIRAILTDGRVVTIAGSGRTGALDGTAAEATFNTPCAVASDADGTIYVADTGNGLIRVISPEGSVSTLTTPVFDGLVHPIALAMASDHLLYVADESGRVLEVSRTGAMRVLAGARAGFSDGPGVDARFRRPSGIAVLAPGRLVVADAGNALVRLVAAAGAPDVARLPPTPAIAPHFDDDVFAVQPLLWPIDPMEGPFEIAGTQGEARGAAGSERLHAGIDVRADEGTIVRAVRDGVITSPVGAADFGSLSESVRVGDLTYMHLRVGRDRHQAPIETKRVAPAYDVDDKLIGMREKRGARFETGDALGTVNAFNHVHLNVGWSGDEQNPLRFRLPYFEDTIPPTIARGGVRLFDEEARPLITRVKGRIVVRGCVQIVVDAWDRAEGNTPRRRLGLYRLGYSVLNADGSPAPGFEQPAATIQFDRLSPQPEVARIVYAPGSGIPVYGTRVTRFRYIVTNTFRDGRGSTGMWDTEPLAPGNYTLRVIAADIRGNEATANRDVLVTIAR
jgi:sugar lactone lactonase YvrE